MTALAQTVEERPARVRRPLSTSAWFLMLALVVLGFGMVASRPPAPPDQGPPQGDVLAAQNAIEALVHPGPAPTALAKLPPDFTAVMGVTPGILGAKDGTVRAVHTDGGCSAPWGDDNTKWDYSVPCKAHDLGYDLLRYADRKGHPLGPEVRAALDNRLSADMHATCGLNPMNSETSCQVVASLYSAGLVVNSWHQRWGPPVGDPLGPMLAGVAAIALLLMFRMSGWLRARRTPRPVRAGDPAPAARGPVDRWTLLGVAAVVLLMLGESATALLDWAGTDRSDLWPLTWLAQLAPLYFFAGGRANAAGWRSALATGGGYRGFLAHRASWLLRPALIFAVVALVVPLALELLGVPSGTSAAVMRIALHPLWLLGLYLLTLVSTPVMLAAQRRSPVATIAGLLGVVVLGEVSANWFGSAVPHYVATFGVVLLAQQVAFSHADGVRPSRRRLLAGATIGLLGLAAASVLTGSPLVLLGGEGSPPALSAPAWEVLILGIAQLSVLGLLAKPLCRIADRAAVTRVVRFALRAPMSLYLGFLSAMLLLVAIVYLPDESLHWLLRPQTALALALLAGPAALVFWWFERPRWFEHERNHLLPDTAATGFLGALLGRAATAFGLTFATLGVFGFALTRFGGGDSEASMLGLKLDPIQSLIHLLLGVFLLHTVRIGTSGRTGTWLLCGLACVPSLLFATDGSGADPVSLTLHLVTAGVALVAVAWTRWPGARAARPARP
ncbi:MAG: hypothetical protein JWQ81_4083 [Amycolatopsis sp.]|uniref:phospholipase A2 n=1 Tax=Amycolatopsis sp. TaxID=37632 RepID=UPI00262BA493|nr:phospholipase A2 [Amycolatopsis sp.]MCU1683344.1 hypothetical protein [Amycolatopsis sp.]